MAVICYPGLIGCRRMDDDSVIDTPESQKAIPKNKKGGGIKKKDKKVLQIGSTSIIPLRGGADCTERLLLDGDSSDRDEAEASDDDMMDEDELDPLEEDISQEDAWVVISAYFSEKGLVRQQLDSFDEVREERRVLFDILLLRLV